MAQSIREKFEAKLLAREKHLKENPEPLYSQSGCKVGWNYYATQEEAEVASKQATRAGENAAAQGYDFGYCSPGSIEEVTVYKVCTT